MAARTSKGTKDLPWPDKVRERIRSGGILTRLVDHVNGKVELSPTQVQAALGLIRKILPDLSATELSGEVDAAVRVVSATPLTPAEWEQQYAVPPVGPNGAIKTNGSANGHG